MKTRQAFIMSFFCLAMGVAYAQNSTVKQVVTNAANNAIQKVVGGTGQTPGINPLGGTTVNNLDNGLNFTVTGCKGDPASQRVTVYFTISNPLKPNQNVSIADPASNYLITAFDDNSKTYNCVSITLADQTGQGSFYSLQMTKELPSGLSIKGSVVFGNVLPNVSTFALVNIYEKSRNKEDGGDAKQGYIELHNIKIDWSNTAATIFDKNTGTPVPQSETNIIKNINNGIRFAITDCAGDSASQRVTLYFTMSNPTKPNQKIQIADPYNNNQATAMDSYSKPYKAVKVALADKHGEGDYAQAIAELPTGLSINGSVTFSNILPSLKYFSLVNLYTRSANFDGGDDEAKGYVEIRNVPITWVKTRPKVTKPANKSN